MDNGILEVTLSKPEGIVTGIQYNGISNLLEVLNDESNRGYMAFKHKSRYLSVGSVARYLYYWSEYADIGILYGVKKEAQEPREHPMRMKLLFFLTGSIMMFLGFSFRVICLVTPYIHFIFPIPSCHISSFSLVPKCYSYLSSSSYVPPFRIKGESFRVVVENEEQVEISFTRTWDPSLEGKLAPLNIDKR